MTLTYLEELFICEGHDSLKDDHAGSIHSFLQQTRVCSIKAHTHTEGYKGTACLDYRICKVIAHKSIKTRTHKS